MRQKRQRPTGPGGAKQTNEGTDVNIPAKRRKASEGSRPATRADLPPEAPDNTPPDFETWEAVIP